MKKISTTLNFPDEPIGRIYTPAELKKIGKENSKALKALKKKLSPSSSKKHKVS